MGVPGRRRIMPVSGVVRRITCEVTGQMLSPVGAPARDGPRTAAAGSGLPARRDLRATGRSSGSSISHGLVKERVVPPREIDRAVERKKQFEANPSRDTYQEAEHG